MKYKLIFNVNISPEFIIENHTNECIFTALCSFLNGNLNFVEFFIMEFYHNKLNNYFSMELHSDIISSRTIYEFKKILTSNNIFFSNFSCNRCGKYKFNFHPIKISSELLRISINF